jgi:hypothetical protein
MGTTKWMMGDPRRTTKKYKVDNVNIHIYCESSTSTKKKVIRIMQWTMKALGRTMG